MKRSAIRRKPSERNEEYRAELDALRPALAERSGGRCEFTFPAHRCDQRASLIHHRWRRSQGGVNRLWNLLHLCWSCHEYIHRNPPNLA